MSKLASSPASAKSKAKPAVPGENAQVIEQFEHSLGELEQLIERMEPGELTLDDTVKSFERGMALYQNCRSALDHAQLRVDLLLKGSADLQARVPFDPETP